MIFGAAGSYFLSKNLIVKEPLQQGSSSLKPQGGKNAAPRLCGVLEIGRDKIEDAVDRIKTEAGDQPLIAVGGAASLVPDRLAGVSQVIGMRYGDHANAAGPGIAQISGETDQIYHDLVRAHAIAAAETQMQDRARPQMVDAEDMPLAYPAGNALWVRVTGEVRAPPNRGSDT
jgi:hypothetical protein